MALVTTRKTKSGVLDLDSSSSWPQPGFEFILLLLWKRPPGGPQWQDHLQEQGEPGQDAET